MLKKKKGVKLWVLVVSPCFGPRFGKQADCPLYEPALDGCIMAFISQIRLQ